MHNRVRNHLSTVIPVRNEHIPLLDSSGDFPAAFLAGFPLLELGDILEKQNTTIIYEEKKKQAI